MRSLSRATPLTLCRTALWGFAGVFVTHTLADADLWGHLRFGLDMLASKSLPLVDPYSFTSDRSWINHEWLAELLMGAAYTVLGSPGLVLLKLGAIAVIAAVLVLVARQEGARPVARDVFVALVLFATYTRTQAVRPQMFSIAIFCVVLYLLRSADRGRTNALWALPLCFAVWVNLHGGWIVGLAFFGVWLAGEALQRRDRWHIVVLAGVGVLCVLATLLNPYGAGLWQFLAETVRTERPDITDWRPLLQLPRAVLAVESVLPLVALAAVWAGRASTPRIPWRDLAALLLLAAAMFRVGRVDAFFQVALAVLMAPQLIALLNRLHVPSFGPLHRRSMAVAVLVLVVAGYMGIAAFQNARIVRVEGRWIPDRAAAMFLRDTRPGAQVLTWFDWGEYALWQLSPAGTRVSMDGRRETVYSQRVLTDHHRFYEGDADMVDYPDRIGADHVWLPADFRIVELLSRAGWTKILETEKSVVLAREGQTTEAEPACRLNSSAAFPWP